MTTASLPITPEKSRQRITSIDAVRGVNIFLMICVNNLAHNPLVPAWMEHYNYTARASKSGMTFVDIVFPAFLFIAGMSIPFALGSRLKKGEPIWKTLSHILLRVLSLLFIGILMVNGRPDPTLFGWSAAAWQTTMCGGIIAAFCAIPRFPRVQLGVRLAGFALLIYLAFAFRGPHDARIITLKPFSINTEWWGILGSIGWAYLMAAIVFLLFRTSLLATLGCVALMVGLYFADKTNTFADIWLAQKINFGDTLGTHAALTTAGMLLGIMLLTPEMSASIARIKFTVLFIAGFAIAALLLNGSYGINKPDATPSWALWSCAFAATAWLILYLVGDVLRARVLTAPLALAGQNVLLAYIISEAFNSTLNVTHLSHWYVSLVKLQMHGFPHFVFSNTANLTATLVRSGGTAVFILALTAILNRIGFRLKL